MREKKRGMERTKQRKHRQHIRGEREVFQFQGDEKSTMISPV